MADRPNPFKSLRTAIERAGSQVAFARLCGVSQPAVSKWLQNAKRLPSEHVLKVEAATGVSKHLLRPDIYPIDVTEIPAPFAAVEGDPSTISHWKDDA